MTSVTGMTSKKSHANSVSNHGCREFVLGSLGLGYCLQLLNLLHTFEIVFDVYRTYLGD